MMQLEQGSALVSVHPPRPPAIRWWRWIIGSLGLVLVGVCLGIGLTFIWILLSVSAPLSSAPLTQPVASNKSDANLTLSQEYINREITGFLNASPVKVLGVLEVKQVVVELKSGSQINIAARAEALGRQLDLNIKDNVSVSNGKVMLSLAESVKAGEFDLGFLNLNGVVDNVNLLVAGEINKLIAGVGSALPGHTPNLQQIALSEGVLGATFEVKVENASRN
jgi:uncharacterized protein YpmS